MRLLIHSTVAVCVAGAIHAIRRAQTARILGIRFPGTAPVHAATIGTPLSAPPAMLATLWIAERTDRRRLVRLLAGVFLFGILAEADTWSTFRHPGDDPLRTGLVVAEIALPIAVLSAGAD